ncbi:MAG TPA: hypothetical protein VM681_10700 [Candidatus Thermoplasmatota archaeon]|nr:hypothetical protein [Candidatus Thermoplasmatota archaeon]
MTGDPTRWGKVAHVARLDLSEPETKRLAAEAEAILARFASDLAGHGDAARPPEPAAGADLREDVVVPSGAADAIRRNFPRERNGVALVPRGL